MYQLLLTNVITPLVLPGTLLSGVPYDDCHVLQDMSSPAPLVPLLIGSGLTFPLLLTCSQNARRLVSSGVSVAYLHRLWKSLPLLLQNVNPATLTVADVVRLVILPATVQHQ